MEVQKKIGDLNLLIVIMAFFLFVDIVLVAFYLKKKNLLPSFNLQKKQINFGEDRYPEESQKGEFEPAEKTNISIESKLFVVEGEISNVDGNKIVVSGNKGEYVISLPLKTDILVSFGKESDLFTEGGIPPKLIFEQLSFKELLTRATVGDFLAYKPKKEDTDIARFSIYK